MKPIKTFMLILLGMLLMASVFAATQKKPESILYVIRAQQRQLVKQGQQYQLIINHPKVSFFTDRPVRVAGEVPTKTFIKTWSEGSFSFAKVNPNAALLSNVKDSVDKQGVQRFVTLSNPVYQAKLDRLVLNVARINDTDPTLQPMQLANMALFIDNGCNIANPPPAGCW